MTVYVPLQTTSPFEMALRARPWTVSAVAAWTWTTAFLAGMVFGMSAHGSDWRGRR